MDAVFCFNDSEIASGNGGSVRSMEVKSNSPAAGRSGVSLDMLGAVPIDIVWQSLMITNRPINTSKRANSPLPSVALAVSEECRAYRVMKGKGQGALATVTVCCRICGQILNRSRVYRT